MRHQARPLQLRCSLLGRTSACLAAVKGPNSCVGGMRRLCRPPLAMTCALGEGICLDTACCTSDIDIEGGTPRPTGTGKAA